MNDNFMNEKLLVILGFATSLILELRKYAPIDKEQDIIWFIQALENTIYKDKPLPPFPEK